MSLFPVDRDEQRRRLRAGLAGNVTLSMSDEHADAFTRNQVIVLAEHDLGPKYRRRAAYRIVHRKALDDGVVEVVIDELLFLLQPWLKPDANPMPRFVPFPRLARAAAWLRKQRRHLATW